jgi:hypothetical protein
MAKRASHQLTLSTGGDETERESPPPPRVTSQCSDPSRQINGESSGFRWTPVRRITTI